jgi:beta-lactamase superfamily II metal-dependent hydrolase
MQLPQHGAARSLSESFLDAVQPQVVILQADAANRRGDPDTSTLAALDDAVPLFRTDEQGVIHLWTDGSTLYVQPGHE